MNLRSPLYRDEVPLSPVRVYTRMRRAAGVTVAAVAAAASAGACSAALLHGRYRVRVRDKQHYAAPNGT